MAAFDRAVAAALVDVPAPDPFPGAGTLVNYVNDYHQQAVGVLAYSGHKLAHIVRITASKVTVVHVPRNWVRGLLSDDPDRVMNRLDLMERQAQTWGWTLTAERCIEYARRAAEARRSGGSAGEAPEETEAE